MNQSKCKKCAEPIEWVWDHLNQRWVPANPGIVQHTGSDEWVLVSTGFKHMGKPAMAFSKSASKGDAVRVPHKCKSELTPGPLPREFRNEEYSLF